MTATAYAVPSAAPHTSALGDVPLMALLERVAQGVLVADDRGVIVFAHPAAAQVLGRPPGELRGQSGAALGEWLRPARPGRAAAPFARALRGEPVEAEPRVASRDGRTWRVRWSEAPLRDDRGVIRGVVAWAQAVSPDEWGGAAVEPLSATGDAHAECRESVATLSHDLKNPLTRIKGLAQLLQRRLASGRGVDPGQLRESLAQIDRTVGKMTITLNELVETAHRPAGEAPALDRRPTDLVAVVRHLIGEYQHATERHRLHLATTQATVIGAWDASRLERAISNLLSNAVKYSPAGGEIRVLIECLEPEGWAMLQVSDEGIGIPEADLPRVFEGAHRAGNVVGRINGTGLGLPAVRQTVEQHGGTVGVESREDGGTTVTVWLPLQPDGVGAGGR
ncbi:MAG TPA: PAS domain-containing sensor histidine kinase [Chloroflexota bacterium]|nr:PAS domain-containing sensor histidine kinase [Chloroflexota bacterium]